VNDLRAALRLLLDHLEERFVRLPAVPREDDLHHAEDPGERIVELVREAGAHLPDRGQARRTDEQDLRFLSSLVRSSSRFALELDVERFRSPLLPIDRVAGLAEARAHVVERGRELAHLDDLFLWRVDLRAEVSVRDRQRGVLERDHRTDELTTEHGDDHDREEHAPTGEEDRRADDLALRGRDGRGGRLGKHDHPTRSRYQRARRDYIDAGRSRVARRRSDRRPRR
jgi:hypothetical protein